MKRIIHIFYLSMILACCTTKKSQILDNQNKQIIYLDSIEGYSFTRSSKRIYSVQLLFFKQFKDTIEIYLNNKKVDSFFKNDNHYDKNGEEYIIQDEIPNIEIRNVEVRRKRTNTILILLKPSNAKVSFEINNDYDNYLVSRYEDHWYFTGLKSKVEKTAANTR